jgi:hypothetical protein
MGWPTLSGIGQAGVGQQTVEGKIGVWSVPSLKPSGRIPICYESC